MKSMILLLTACLLYGTVSEASAEGSGGTPLPGFIVLAEHRFDPAVQRLIAERSLKALPLRDGQLLYLYPIGIEPQIEEVQIRYVEVLLEKRAAHEPGAE